MWFPCPDSVELLSATAEAAVDLSAPVVVFHGSPFAFTETELPSRLDDLLHMSEPLDPVAEKTKIVVALQNGLPDPATDIVRQALSSLGSQHFGLCYDSSHDQIGGPKSFDLVTELSDRVIAVHLSDRVREFADHVIPGEGFIDWAALSEMMKSSSLATSMEWSWHFLG